MQGIAYQVKNIQNGEILVAKISRPSDEELILTAQSFFL